MNQLDELECTSSLLRDRLQSQIDQLSEEDPFYSILTRKTILNVDLESYKNAWQEDWTFADYVKYYNDADVSGFTEALVKFLKFNQAIKLDVFKMSMSLPGLTKRYVFQNLPKGDYFSGFGEKHKWLVKDLRNSIIGGPSIHVIFMQILKSGNEPNKEIKLSSTLVII